MPGRVDGKVALITGAARGQGRSHAVRLAEEGADIIALDICAPIDSVAGIYPPATPEDLAETVAQVEKFDRRVVARQVDVRDLAALQAAVGEGVAELGRLDIVVANAGIVSYGMTWEIDEETWREVIDVNLTGAFLTAKATVPVLIEAGRGGSIVFTSSVGGLKGFQYTSHYVSSKHGVVGLARSMANELAGHHIRVNTVNPTTVATPMVQNDYTYALFAPDDPEPSEEKARPGFTAANAMPIPWVESIDVSNAVLFLASDEARYITGIALPVDAGSINK